MDFEMITDTPSDSIPAQRGSASCAEVNAPVAGCLCRDCQGARFV